MLKKGDFCKHFKGENLDDKKISNEKIIEEGGEH